MILQARLATFNVASLACFMRGADGNRTRVRTGKQYAFYMLIFALVFVRRQDRSHLSTALSAEIFAMTLQHRHDYP